MDGHKEQVINPNHADRMIAQGHALVRVIEGLDTIEPTGRIERALVALLVATYVRRLRAIVLTLVPSAQL